MFIELSRNWSTVHIVLFVTWMSQTRIKFTISGTVSNLPEKSEGFFALKCLRCYVKKLDSDKGKLNAFHPNSTLFKMDSQLTAGINFRQLSFSGFCISMNIIETHIIITLASFKTYFIWYLPTRWGYQVFIFKHNWFLISPDEVKD